MIWPRIVVAVIFLALPLWAGATARSFWILPVLVVLFAIAFVDGKNQLWRKSFIESSIAEKAKAIGGAIVSQAILVSLLYFVSFGVAGAFGFAGDRTPFEPLLDLGAPAAMLAFVLVGGAAIRWADGGRDPVMRAFEQHGDVGEKLRELADRLDDLKDTGGFGDAERDAAESEANFEQLTALEERDEDAEEEIARISGLFVVADPSDEDIERLIKEAKESTYWADMRRGNANRRRAALIALRALCGRAPQRMRGYRAMLSDCARSTLFDIAPATVKLNALQLAEAVKLEADQLTARLQAFASGEPINPPDGDRAFETPEWDRDAERELRQRAATLLA